MSLLKYARFLPTIRDAVVFAESLIPEGGKGKDKLAFVIELLTSGIDATADGKIDRADLAAWLERIIPAIVRLLNAVGWPKAHP